MPRFTLLPAASCASLLLAALLSGCLSVPRDQARMAGPDVARVRHAPDLVLPADAWPAEQWWLAYHDPQLDQLVARALRDHPSLALAQARVASATSLVEREQAEAGGQVGVHAGLNRQRYSSNGFFPAPIGGAWYNDASLQLKASYDFDWWGRHRDLIAAALGESSARRAEAAQVAQTLAATTVQSYLRLQMLWARRDNVRAQIALQRDLLAERQARMAQGLLASEAVAGAGLDLATLEEQAQHADTDAAREREVLRALIGGDAGALTDLRALLPAPAIDAVPRELGLALLARRPDLQAARWRVESQLGRVAASEAAFRPDINLAAVLGLDAISLGKLLRYPSRAPLIGAALDLPLFDSGRLNAQLGAARSERDALLAQYNDAVMTAVREVAQEAATLQGMAREGQAHQVTAAAARELLANTEARQKHGLADRGTVLAAREAVLRQRDVELRLADARLQTQVALIKALGGGYGAPASISAHAAAPDQNNTIQSH